MSCFPPTWVMILMGVIEFTKKIAPWALLGAMVLYLMLR